MTRAQARLFRQHLNAVVDTLDDTAAIEVPDLFMPWRTAVQYAAGDRVQYEGNLYKCLQAHTSQPDWTPDAAVSLWVRVDDPSIEWPEWHQPTGAHDAYALGAKVSHNSKHWISDIDYNTYEPGVYGWTEAE